MHEVGLVEGAIRTAVSVMQAAGASSIERMTFAIAPGGHISPEAVETLFSSLSAGTPANGAQLAFEALDQEFGCWECGHTFTASEREPVCSACGGRAVKPLLASELVLKFVDVAEPADNPPALPGATFIPR